ncbi:MAG: cob(I)yrinic acid a,c-diamide adenosyltransferase [Solirubrobacterales bacterium]
MDLLLPEAADRDRLQSAVGGAPLKIYTRKGDDGTTGLWYGGRRPKSDARIEAYGTIDEAGSALGVARSLCRAGKEEVERDVLHVQGDLFVAGAELAAAPEAAERLEDGVSRVTGDMVAALEPLIDGYMERVELPPKFVVPGGTELSAALDLARAILRRAERRVATMFAAEELDPTPAVAYLNRAADLVYAMARYTDVSDPALFEGRRGRADQEGR